MRHFLSGILCAALMIALTSCETPMDESTQPSQQTEDTQGNVTFTVNSFDMVSFNDYFAESRSSASARELCSRLAFVVYTDGIRVGYVNQLITDKNFGTVGMQLEEGTYTLVVVGYSGMGNATTTNPEKITFTGSHVSDTFWTCQEFTVGSEQTTVPIDLKRVVACVKFQLTDEEIPTNLRTIKCYYTGGSSTLNGFTGYGAVDSRQTEELALKDDNSFEIFTIPHFDKDELNITIQALDNNGVTLAEKAFSGVPVQVNYITRYFGEFFSEEPDESSRGVDITVKGNKEWAGQTDLTF